MKTAIFLSLVATGFSQTLTTATRPSVQPGGPIQPCTSTITEHAAFGCTQTRASYTATTSIDCEGCILTTTTVPPIGGPGPVCVGGIKTVFTKSTTTATACASGTT